MKQKYTPAALITAGVLHLKEGINSPEQYPSIHLTHDYGQVNPSSQNDWRDNRISKSNYTF